jgi:hypothetical protein
MSPYRIKIIIALLLAFGSAWFLNKEVFLLNTPIIRADTPQRIVQLPQNIFTGGIKIIASLPKPPTSTTRSEQGGSILPTGRAQTQPYPLPPADSSQPQQPPNNPDNGGNNGPSPTPQWITIVPPTNTPYPTQRPNYPTYTPPPPTPTPRPVTKVEFAQCLTSKGMKFYSNVTCPYCAQQKADFGTQAWGYITEINCTAQTQTCRSKAGVGIGPAWEESGGKVWPGAMDFRSLGYVSKCQAPSI